VMTLIMRIGLVVAHMYSYQNFEPNFLHLLVQFGKTEDIIVFFEAYNKAQKKDIDEEYTKNDPRVSQKKLFLKLLNEENTIGWIPIYYAPQHKSVDLMKIMYQIDKGQITHISMNGTVLIRSCEVTTAHQDGSSLRCVKFLMEECKLDVNQTDKVR